jgi:hypothetical protein
METNESPPAETNETQPTEPKHRLLKTPFLWGSEIVSIRKQVCPDLKMDAGSLKMMDAMVNYFMKTLIKEATKHVDSNGLDVREIMAAVNQVFPEQLAKNAHQHGLEVVNQTLPKGLESRGKVDNLNDMI